MKTCRICNIEKPLSEFRLRKSRKGNLVPRNECKCCKSKIDAEYRAKNREKVLAKKAEYREANRESIREADREKYAADENRRSTVQSRVKLWRKENREQYLETNRQYHLDNRDEILLKQAKYRKHNAPKIRKTIQTWESKNPEKVIATKLRYKAKRRSTLGKAMPPWADESKIKQIYELAAKRNREGTPTHVDHIVPLHGKRVCGLHCEDNLQLLSPEENMRKSNKHG